MTREEDVEPALEVEFGMLDYKSSIDSTEGIVSRVHAVAAAPMPPGSDFAFFDPKEPSCQTLLLSPSTTVSQLFAVLRQWVPQVQQHVALIGNEMLKRGCHPNDRDELTDMTLLHYTCKAGAPGIGHAEAAAAFAGRLLTLGANPSLRSRWTGMNALHYAAYFDVPELIPVVLQAAGPKEVDATCSDFDFGTALHIAASNLCLSAAKSLLEHSANPLFKNNRGQVPCDVVPDAADMPLEMAEVALVAREIRRLLSRATAAPALLPTPPLPSQPPAPPGLTVGQRVIVGGRKTGVLRFCGPTEFAGGQWAGVELDEADGKNNGSVDGTRYFTCAPRHGIFAPLSKVASAEESSRRGSLNSSGAIRGAAPVLRIAARGLHADPCHDDAASRRTAGHTNMKTLSGPRRKAQASAFSSDASAENNSNTPQGSGSSSSGSSSPHLTRRRASVTLPLKPSRNAGGAQPPRTKPAESRIQHGVRKRLPSSESGGTSDGAAELELGERLLVSGQRAGVLRFQGTTHFAPGHWYGIELEQPSGRNDGSVAGVRYFQCPAKHGVFAPPSRVQSFPAEPEYSQHWKTAKEASGSDTHEQPWQTRLLVSKLEPHRCISSRKRRSLPGDIIPGCCGGPGRQRQGQLGEGRRWRQMRRSPPPGWHAGVGGGHGRDGHSALCRRGGLCGGHVVGPGTEGATRKARRCRGRPPLLQLPAGLWRHGAAGPCLLPRHQRRPSAWRGTARLKCPARVGTFAVQGHSAVGCLLHLFWWSFMRTIVVWAVWHVKVSIG
ncbi:CAP-Gly domain-containing linker protein 4-like isoform X1 [Lampetra fluviatilis]